MTLAALHARFLHHCTVEKRLRHRRSRTLSPQGRGQGEGPRVKGPTLRTFTTTLIRDYQAHMATRRWSVNTVRRRLVELNRFAGWLVERRYLQRSPMIGISPGGR